MIISSLSCAARNADRCVLWLIRSVFVTALSVLVVFNIACGQKITIERIPGTERAGVKAGESITISPDGEWLIFLEWIATPPESRDRDDGGRTMAMKPVSLNLETVVRTEHSRNGLPPPRFGYTYDWAELEVSFRSANWHDGKLYFEMRPLKDVFIDPKSEPLGVSPRPDIMQGCSDCPPPSVLRQAVHKIAGASRHGYCTAAWSNGQLSETMYCAASDGIVEKIGPDGTRTVLFQKQFRGRFTEIKRLRISPDEEYLAYSVYSKLNAPIPLPGGRDDIYIYHVPTGEEKKIASYSSAGNFIWSPDSKYLYFAARKSGFKEMGVYRVCVGDIFR